MWTTPTLLLSCSFHALALLLPFLSPAPASAPPLPYSCPAPCKLLSCTFLAPPQFLPSSCPLSARSCFTLLSSAPAPLLPCSCLLLTYSCLLLSSAHPSLAAFTIIRTLTFFGTARSVVLKLPKRAKSKKEKMETLSLVPILDFHVMDQLSRLLV